MLKLDESPLKEPLQGSEVVKGEEVRYESEKVL